MRRRRRRGRRDMWRILTVFVIAVLLLSGLGIFIRHQNQAFYGSSGGGRTGGGSSDKEASESVADVDESLAERIEQNRERIPEELLEALEKNPELAEFVADYPESEKKGVKSFLDEETKEEFPLLLQWDKRWGYADYGDSVIGLSGCGPTCLSMVVFSLTRREVTPYEVAGFSERNGYYVEGAGTSWELMTRGAAHYGLSAVQMSLDEERIKRVLDNGGMIICAMRPGDFTTEGHFIVIYGYDGEGFMVNDPNSVVRSKKRWSMKKLSPLIKNLWGYYG